MNQAVRPVGSMLIRGARVFDPAGPFDTVRDVFCVEGRIAQPDGVSPDQVIDGRGLTLAPGFVDLHCHLREPGQEYKETIASGTAAAAHGGFTTVCAMPNTEPAMDSRAVVEFVLREAAAHGQARVLPIGAVTVGRAGVQLAELGELAAAGCVAFSDDGNPVATAELMRRALEYAGGIERTISDHCEEPSLARGGVMNEGWVSTRLGLKGQPNAAEEAMVARDIQLAELTGSPVHIAHVSTAGAVELVRAARAHGVPVTAEVAPHHLALTDEAVLYGPVPGASRPYDTNARVNPPLRTDADRQACVRGLEQGVIDAIATDHAPHATVDKECEFDLAANGISGLETALAAVLSLVQRGELSFARALEALTTGPVRALRLQRFVAGLGLLTPRAPADLVLFDPAMQWTVDPAAFASKGKNSPFAGQRVQGRVLATVYGGRLVYAHAAMAGRVTQGSDVHA